MNRKGNAITDGAITIIILIAVAFAWIFTAYITDGINEEFQDDDDLDAANKQIIDDVNTQLPSLFDGLFLLVFLGLWLALLLASWNVSTSPVYYVVSVIFMLFMLSGMIYLSNAVEEVSQDEDLSSTFDMFPITMWFLDNLVMVSLIILISDMVVLYASRSIL